MFKNIKSYAPFYLPLIVGSFIFVKGNNLSKSLSPKCYICGKYDINDKYSSVDCLKITK